MPERAVEDLLRDWAIEQALPLWAEAGYDRTNGGFHERLLLDGSPDHAAPRRLVVQARQIYVYALASVLGWFDGKQIALDAFQAMRDRYASPDGKPGYVHILDADGSIHDPRRDSYGHAFVLLALAWLARATGDAQIKSLIDETLGFFDEHLTAGDGTFLEGVPATLPRRQNPHMHAFESMLALHETIAHPQALSRAAGLRGLLKKRFIDPENGALFEFFTDAWKIRSLIDPVEPGHHAEWSWLLRRHESLAGLPPDPLAQRFVDFAARYADAHTGLLPDEIRLDGAAHPQKHRCWPQTEFAKALLTAEESGMCPEADATAALARLHRHHLSGCIAGGWIDQVDAAGNPVVQTMPASTFYHVFCAIAEAARVRGAKRAAS